MMGMQKVVIDCASNMGICEDMTPKEEADHLLGCARRTEEAREEQGRLLRDELIRAHQRVRMHEELRDLGDLTQKDVDEARADYNQVRQRYQEFTDQEETWRQAETSLPTSVWEEEE